MRNLKRSQTSNEIMILRIRAIGVAVLLAIPCAFLLVPTANVRSAPKVQAPKVEASKEKPFLWQGQTLPIPLAPTADEFEGESRNEHWQDFARLLRVRDLRVYTWAFDDSHPGEAEKQHEKVLNWLRLNKYQLKKTRFPGVEDYGRGEGKGFEARRGSEILAGLWAENNLYWGHQVPATPAQKLNDALAQAISDGAPARVQTLLQRGADPRSNDYAGGTMLMRAIYSDNAESLRLLLKAQGATCNQSPDFGDALDVAAENDNAAAVAVFLEMGANSVQIGQALGATATRGAAKAARILLPKASQADVEATLVTASYVDDWRGDTVQWPEIVKLMLTRKPSKLSLNQALARVCDADNAGIMDLLLAAGANPDTRRDGKPVLLCAACSHRNYTVEPLLRHGANPNIQTATGETALMVAASCFSSFPRDVEDLLRYGADANLRDNKGQTALDMARSNLASAQQDGWLQERQKIVALLEAATQDKSK